MEGGTTAAVSHNSGNKRKRMKVAMAPFEMLCMFTRCKHHEGSFTFNVTKYLLLESELVYPEEVGRAFALIDDLAESIVMRNDYRKMNVYGHECVFTIRDEKNEYINLLLHWAIDFAASSHKRPPRVPQYGVVIPKCPIVKREFISDASAQAMISEATYTEDLRMEDFHDHFETLVAESSKQFDDCVLRRPTWKDVFEPQDVTTLDHMAMRLRSAPHIRAIQGLVENYDFITVRMVIEILHDGHLNHDIVKFVSHMMPFIEEPVNVMSKAHPDLPDRYRCDAIMAMRIVYGSLFLMGANYVPNVSPR